MAVLLPGLCCPLWLRRGAALLPAILPVHGQGVHSSGTQHRNTRGSWHPWAGIASDAFWICFRGSAVTMLPCPHSVSGPCVTYVCPHTSPTPLKWTRRWGLL